ncbi:MAG: TonB-dependent receptor [Caulobacteraceae bacterium]|nr:TonB-dependent receptor [Caulobacteraceae bacterium]
MTISTLPKRRALRRLPLFLGAALTAAMAAAAGQAATAPPPAGGAPETVEEVVITAQKRAENMQAVGMSVESVSANTLAKLGVNKLQDIQSAAPSVTFGDGGEQGRYGIRGIVDYSRNAGYDSRVGVYIDGVYIGRSYLNNQTLLGVQQVDVLRGPQGTLFGKNTDAGVISITTRKPSSTFGGTAEAEVGNYGEYRLSALVNGPITTGLDGQFAITRNYSDGYYHNVQLHNDNMGQDGIAARAQLRWRPTDKLDINLSVDGLRDFNSTLHYSYLPTAGSDVYNFKSYNHDHAVINSWGTALNVDYQLGGGYQLTSISALRGGSQYLNFNNEVTTFPLLTAVFREQTHQFSEELRVASPKTEHYDWVAGLYYFNQLNDEKSADEFGSGMAYLPSPYPLYANVTIPIGAKVQTNSYAAFFNGNYRIIPQVELTGGLRYTIEDKDLRDFYAHDPYQLVAGNFSGKSDSMSTYKLTPKVGVNFHLTSKIMVFALVDRGFKSGGWNLDSSTPSQLAAGIRVRPETVTNYEAGLKSDFWDGRARLNATVFDSKFDAFQVFTFVPVQVGGQTVQVTSLTNAGTVTSKGLELEGDLIPLPGLTLSANYTYNESKYDNYPGGGGTAGGKTLSANGVQTPYAPKNKAYFSVDYQHGLDSQFDGFVHLGYSVQSSENFDPKVVNPVYGKYYAIPGYDLFDARIGVTSVNGRWEVSLWGKNLADKRYIVFANRTAVLANPAVMYGPPLTYGVTLKVHY